MRVHRASMLLARLLPALSAAQQDLPGTVSNRINGGYFAQGMERQPWHGEARPMVVAVKGGAQTATGEDLVTTVKTSPINGPFNVGCGGHVWAVGNLGHATQKISGGVLPTEEQSVAYDGTSLTFVLFEISPCGVHPWHVHQNMDEIVYVSGGGGRINVMDPSRAVIEKIQVAVGDLVVLPTAHMHTFEASTDGLQLVAFSNANYAHLALMPLFFAMLPPPVQRQWDPTSKLVAGDGSPDFFSAAYDFENNMPPGEAMVCANVTANRTGSGCWLKPDAPSALCTTKVTEYPNLQCTEMLSSSEKYVISKSVATCDRSTGNATDRCKCQLDRTVCVFLPPFAQAASIYMGRIRLDRGQLLGPAQQICGGIGGYVLSGKFWFMFLNPVLAYATQFKVEAGQTFYVPPNVFISILGMSDDSIAVLAISNRLGTPVYDAQILVPFGPLLNVVNPETLAGYFGWNAATAELFNGVDHDRYGGLSDVPELIPWAESLENDQVLCPETNMQQCTDTEPFHTLKAGPEQEGDSTSTVAYAALVIGAVSLALNVILCVAFLLYSRQGAPPPSKAVVEMRSSTT